MIIKKVEIGNFGKLSNCSIEFSDKIHILYGHNEYGKSTIMEFIKMMFYSDMGKTKNSAVRQNRIPWSGGKMYGAIEFIHQKKLYRIQKQFDDSTPLKDKVEFRNVSDSENVILGKREEIGKRLFGLDLGAFEKSGYIGSLGETAFEDEKSREKGIINLINTGSEEISCETSEKRISEAIKDLKWKNNNGGKIIVLEKEIEELTRDINTQQKEEIEQKEIKQKIDEIDNLIKEREYLREAIKIKKISEKLQNLDKLSSAILQKNEIKKRVSGKNSDFEKSRREIIESQKVLDEISSLEKDCESLKISIDNQTDHLVDKTEKEHVDNLVAAKNELQNLVVQIEDLKKDIKRLKLYETQYSDMEKLYQKFEQESDALQNLLNKQAKSLENGKNELGDIDEQNKKIKNKYILVSLIAVCAGLLFAAFFVYSGLLTAALLSILFPVAYILYSCVNFKKLSSSLDLKSSQIQAQDAEFTAKNQEFKQNYQSKFAEYRLNIKNKKQIFEYELSSITARLKDICSKMDMDIQEFSSRSENGSQLEKNIREIESYLSLKVKNREIQIEKLLKLKDCSSLPQYYEKYEHTLQLQGNVKIIKEKTDKISELKNQFTDSMSAYTTSKNYSEILKKHTEICEFLKQFDEKENEIKIFLQIEKLDSENLENIYKIIAELKSELQAKTTSQHFSLEENFKSKDISDFEKRLEFLENQHLDSVKECEKEKLTKPEQTLLELSKELQDKKEKLKSYKRYLKSLEFAKTTLEEAYKEIKENIRPKIDEYASQIFNKITNKNHDSLSIQDNFEILIKSGTLHRKHNIFSSGTIDQAYLSLRIALSQILSPETLIPILLDDILTRYDDQRLELTLNYLKNYTNSSPKEERQIILFTCHSHTLNCAKALGIHPVCPQFT